MAILKSNVNGKQHSPVITNLKKPLSNVENLREFYITSDYLRRMQLRARSWEDAFIQNQITYFKHTIPDYPEVCELLETELHTRNLNQLHRKLRSLEKKELKILLQKYKLEPDYCELIESELEIRTGVKVLYDKSVNESH